MNLSLAMSTSRPEPHVDWLAKSLRKQLLVGERPQLILIDFWSQVMPMHNWTEAHVDTRRMKLLKDIGGGFDVTLSPPKPTVWQGPHRLTQSDYWAKSSGLNSAICLCKHDWFATVDDRAVLAPTWLSSVRAAMNGKYSVAGAYEKRRSMFVQRGDIKGEPTFDIADKNSISGRDHRELKTDKLTNATGAWWFGCTNAVPLEWALQVNGYEEHLDSLKMEDTQFGSMLEANGYPIKYDPRMKVILDRTPEALTSDPKSDCKERHPHDKQDKGHAAIKRFWGIKRTENPFDLRKMRESVLSGQPFSVPDGPTLDWFDGQPLSEFK